MKFHWNIKNPIKDLFFFTLLWLFTSMTLSTANDGVMGVTPDGVYPIIQQDIMMQSEEIVIDCTTGKVTCRFDFKNFGAAQKVTIGFPARLNENVDDSLTTEEDITVRNFTARDENGEIPVSLSDTIPNPPMDGFSGMEKYSKWYTFSVDFEENEIKTLYHTYDVQFSYYSNGEVIMGYVIETGALWKGPIGNSRVVFDFGDIPLYSITQVYPNNFYKIEGHQLIFERSNFKPEGNLYVSINQARYDNLEWFDVNFSGIETKEDAKRKIELFKVPPEAIKNDSKKFFKRYLELVNIDPISALYIKSALELPNGDDNPRITDCRITEHKANFWRFEICGEDPDGDTTSYKAEIEGIEHFRYDNDGLYFNREENKVKGHGRLEVKEEVKGNTPFCVSFTMTDAAGNSDTETLLLRIDAAPEPEQTPLPETSAPAPVSTPVITGIPTPVSTPVITGIPEATADTESSIPVYESTNTGSKVFPMEDGTLSILTIGITVVLILSLAVIVFMFFKQNNKWYLLFILQLIFLGLSIYQAISLLNMRDMTDGVMLSENVTLKVVSGAVYWALSMLWMLTGIILTAKDSNK